MQENRDVVVIKENMRSSRQETQRRLVKIAAAYAKTQGIEWAYGHTAFSREGTLGFLGNYLVITNCQGVGDVHITVDRKTFEAIDLKVHNWCKSWPLTKNDYPLE